MQIHSKINTKLLRLQILVRLSLDFLYEIYFRKYLVITSLFSEFGKKYCKNTQKFTIKFTK